MWTQRAQVRGTRWSFLPPSLEVGQYESCWQSHIESQDIQLIIAQQVTSLQCFDTWDQEDSLDLTRAWREHPMVETELSAIPAFHSLARFHRLGASIFGALIYHSLTRFP